MSTMRDHVESCTAELEEVTQCNYTPSSAAVEPDLEQAVPQLVSVVDVCRVISLTLYVRMTRILVKKRNALNYE